LRNASDGRAFEARVSTVSTGRLWEIATYADAWRQIGLEVEELQVPRSRSRDLEYRALYPSWEASSAGNGDQILRRLAGPAASAETRWSGNRGGYEDPAAQNLLGKYYSSMTEPEQRRTMRAISDFVAAELPLLISYFNTHYAGVRKGVKALDDVSGGRTSAPYGAYSRNAHLWEVQ
jgi:ABC-type transport system substrate-binding protein